VINWARKFEIGDLKANNELKEMVEKLGLKANGDSIGLMDTSNVKMLITNSSLTAKAHTTLKLEQIDKVIRALGNEGDLIITSKPNEPVIISKENGDKIVIAPAFKEE